MSNRFTKRKEFDGRTYVWDNIIKKWVVLSVVLNLHEYQHNSIIDFMHLDIVSDLNEFTPNNIIETHDDYDFADAFEGGGSGGGGAEGSYESSSSESNYDSGSSDSGSCDCGSSSCD